MKFFSLAGLWMMLSTAVSAYDLTLVYEDVEWVLGWDELLSLPLTELETRTPWTNDVDHYRGISVADLILHFGLVGKVEQLRLTALNDYAVDAPAELLLDAHGVVVFERNGEPMPVRAYGPFWMLFPFTDRPELVNRDIRNVSVWQLKRIEFLP